MRLPSAALAPLVLAVLGATAVPVGAQTTPAVAEAEATVARLRAEAEALAGAYYTAVGRLAEVQQRIETIEARIPALTAQVADLRHHTRVRAVAAYKRSGNDLASVLAAEDPLDAARRVRWLDRLNARDDSLARDLQVTTSELDAQRRDLQQARASAEDALEAARAQGEQIDALLVDAETRRRSAIAAITPAPTLPPAASAPSPTPTTQPATSAPPAAPPSYTPTPGTHPRHDEPFLVCTRTREASGRYTAYNPAGPYMGAYQFLQSTWNSAASHAGRPELIGVPPHTASPYDQDEVAWALYQWQGSRPWGGLCDDA